MALSITQLNSVSHQYFEKRIIQQVYQDNILLDMLAKKNRITWSGGTKLHVPIRHDSLSHGKMVDPDDARLTLKKDTRTAMELDWAYGVCDIVMTWQERVTNGKDGRIADLLADKVEEGTQDLKKLISTNFYQAFADKGTLDMDGFFTAVRNPSATTSYGGISSADASNWIAGMYDTTTSTLGLYGTGSMDYALRSCHFNGFPDLIVTTNALASIYASKLQPGERRVPENGQAGATDLSFAGVQIVADDEHCPANSMLFIDTDQLFLYWHEGDGIERCCN